MLTIRLSLGTLRTSGSEVFFFSSSSFGSYLLWEADESLESFLEKSMYPYTCIILPIILGSVSDLLADTSFFNNNIYVRYHPCFPTEDQLNRVSYWNSIDNTRKLDQIVIRGKSHPEVGRSDTNVCFIGFEVFRIKDRMDLYWIWPRVRKGLVQEVICDYCNNAYNSITLNLLKGSERTKFHHITQF